MFWRYLKKQSSCCSFKSIGEASGVGFSVFVRDAVGLGSENTEQRYALVFLHYIHKYTPGIAEQNAR